MKKTNKNTNMGVALGMCFGISIGTAFGSMYGNMALGSCLGLSIGLVLGLVIGSQKVKKVNEQVSEKGYTIKTIDFIDEKKGYAIIIVDHFGEEMTVIIPKGQMETENFTVGDIVFLDDDGLIEQAYDKEDK